TRFSRDWSSDVCSSDLNMKFEMTGGRAAVMAIAVALLLVPTAAEAQLGGLGRRIKDKAKERVEQKEDQAAERIVDAADPATAGRSEERRVGKEGSWWGQ